MFRYRYRQTVFWANRKVRRSHVTLQFLGNGRSLKDELGHFPRKKFENNPRSRPSKATHFFTEAEEKTPFLAVNPRPRTWSTIAFLIFQVVTTAAYMCETGLHEIHDGIGEMVSEVLKLAK